MISFAVAEALIQVKESSWADASETPKMILDRQNTPHERYDGPWQMYMPWTETAAEKQEARDEAQVNRQWQELTEDYGRDQCCPELCNQGHQTTRPNRQVHHNSLQNYSMPAEGKQCL